MKTALGIACLGTAALMVVGCVNARAPDIYFDRGPEPAAVDSSDSPRPETLAEAQAELDKAYQQIRYLEHQNERCQQKLEEARKRGDEYKRKHERLKDKYDD
jgi:predicted RNase H-like nuclease (RuvC/YqgF family)